MELNCPSEGCDYMTDTEYGLKVHHGQTHDEPYPDNVYECVNCGDKFTASPSEGTDYCSHSCYSDDSKGKNKGFGSEDAKYRNKEWLAEKLSEHDLSTIANECDVQVDTIRKWKDKHEIGLEYECPSCDKMFSTLRGRNSHHKHVHGKSIRGFEYECEWCGAEFIAHRSPEHNNPPKYCKNCYGKHMEGENNPNKDPERQEKISRGMIKAYAEGRKKVRGREPIYNPLTGNKLDSGWEKKVDTILYKSDYDYKYNGSGDFKRYKINNFTHAPDFIIDDVVDEDIIIEVKGGQTVFYQEGKMNEIADNLTERSDVIYVMIGDSNGLSSDYFIEYKNRDRLVDIIDEISGKQKNSLFDY